MRALAAAIEGAANGSRVEGPVARFEPRALLRGTALSVERAGLAGRRVAIDVADMANALAAAIELDGLAARLLMLPPGIGAEVRQEMLALAEIDALVVDAGAEPIAGLAAFAIDLRRQRECPPTAPRIATQWALPTSGTSGKPKLALHSLASLAAAIAPAPPTSWGTFYDIRRYGGLQIALRALLCGGDLTLTSAEEPLPDFLARLAAAGATHVSGTPSHWRRVLMDASPSGFNPRAIRLSGEIADENVLAALRARFPEAEIAHAYASTEAGVGFLVTDGRAGFPAAWLDAGRTPRLSLRDGTLRLSGPGVAGEILGAGGVAVDDDGLIDSGDAVEIRGDRCHFLGRRNGVINVGGAKVSPETVEAALSAHSEVLAARVSARRSPITGAIVVAEVVARPGSAPGPQLKAAILEAAARQLKPHETPAMLTFVDHLPLTSAGKIARQGTHLG